MYSVRENIIRENVKRILGNKPETELIIKCVSDKITQEEIEQFHKQREADLEAFKEAFQFDKPQQETITPSKTIYGVIISNDNDNSDIRLPRHDAN